MAEATWTGPTVTPVDPADRRAALIAGGSSGIGLAVATALARRGYALTIVGRSSRKLEAAVASLGGTGTGRVRAVSADVGVPGACEAVVAEHVAELGRLDVVCIAAGTGSPGGLDAGQESAVQRMLAVNVEAPIALLRAARPHLRRVAAEGQSAYAFIVASLSALRATPGFAVYSATKAALRSLAQSVNDDLAPGVRACALCPGYVDTPLTAWVRDKVDPSTMIHADDVARRAVEMLLDLSPHCVVEELVMRRATAQPMEP